MTDCDSKLCYPLKVSSMCNVYACGCGYRLCMVHMPKIELICVSKWALIKMLLISCVDGFTY